MLMLMLLPFAVVLLTRSNWLAESSPGLICSKRMSFGRAVLEAQHLHLRVNRALSLSLSRSDRTDGLQQASKATKQSLQESTGSGKNWRQFPHSPLARFIAGAPEVK